MTKRFPKPKKWYPDNPLKYNGDPTTIITRSSWEIRFACWCDKNSSVVSWNSEETIIPYRCGTDNKIHRYYIDFKIQIQNKDGIIKTYLVEIKPAYQCVPPVFKGKQTKRYINESMTYIKNQSKWDYAKQYAKDRGWEFIVLDENSLGIK